MTEDQRVAWMIQWNGIVVFASVLYLTGGPLKAALIAIFVLVSAFLGFGRRWLLRIGFAGAILAIAVALRILPRPEHWPDLLTQAWDRLLILAG